MTDIENARLFSPCCNVSFVVSSIGFSSIAPPGLASSLFTFRPVTQSRGVGPGMLSENFSLIDISPFVRPKIISGLPSQYFDLTLNSFSPRYFDRS